MLKRLLLPAALLLLGCGCGSADRPETGGPMVTGGGSVDPVLATTGESSHVCEALSYRDCKITYVDEDGQVQCPTQVQICNAAGTAWLDCGQYVYDENGEPRLRGK
jgi:hypothetical protein